MAGSHRATQPAEPVKRSEGPARRKASPRLSTRSIIIAIAIALLPALWLGAQRLTADDNAGQQADLPIPDVASTRSPSITPTPRPSATATPSKPAPTLPRVAASPPRRLSVRGLDVGFDNSIEPSDGLFEAASTAEAARWGSRGVPASPGTDTVFMVGKVYTQGASAFAGLARVRAGDEITLRTQSGAVLTYTVQTTGTRAAKGILATNDFTSNKAGRLVLVGILYDDQDDARTGRYRVVVAQLSGARSA